MSVAIALSRRSSFWINQIVLYELCNGQIGLESQKFGCQTVAEGNLFQWWWALSTVAAELMVIRQMSDKKSFSLLRAARSPSEY